MKSVFLVYNQGNSPKVCPFKNTKNHGFTFFNFLKMVN